MPFQSQEENRFFFYNHPLYLPLCQGSASRLIRSPKRWGRVKMSEGKTFHSHVLFPQEPPPFRVFHRTVGKLQVVLHQENFGVPGIENTL